jgi:hypothetical protein
MENKIVNLEIQSNIDSITKDVKKLNTSFEDTSDEIKGIQKSTKNAESGIKSLADGFKGMGLAIKAIGIGLVMEAFNMFKDILGQNQKVVDAFNTVIGALGIAFNDLIGFVMDKFPAVVSLFKDVFENPTKYLQKFGDLVKENLTERFNSFLDTIGFVGEAIKKVFEGDFAGAMESVKKAGKESLDVLSGVNNSFDRGKKFVTDAADAIGNYAVKTLKASQANVELQNAALLAAAEQGKLVEQYGIDAEKLRKIRDNDLLSVADRIKANNDLKDVLQNQQNAMLKQAKLQVDAAQATFNANKRIENEVALINAKKDALGVLNQIEGLTSEQESNRVALKKELEELNQSEIQGINDLAIEKKKFNEELETNELKRLQNQRANLEEEKTIKLQELQNNINIAALGTQARVDAEKEYAIKKQEIDNALIVNATETKKKILEEEKAIADGKRAIQEATLSSIEGGLGLLKTLFEGNEAVQKSLIIGESAVGIARIIIGTQAADAADTAAAALMGPFGVGYLATKKVLNRVSAGIGIASNIAATSKALSALGGGGAPSSSGVGSAGGSGPSMPPNFNVVGASSTNQLAQTIGTQQNTPVQAYVVSNDVTTAQALNRNIIRGASL